MSVLKPSQLGNWAGTTPEDAASWFSSLTVPWWIAGGWALDLFLGRQFREHGDFDVGVLRRDFPQLRAALSNWEVFEAQNNVLSLLPYDAAPRRDVNSLWCRPPGSLLWSLEVLLDAGDTEFWVFRREPKIRRPWSEVIRRTPQGQPYLAPEIQLLYKARSPRPRDEEDFAQVIPRLDASARKWIRESLQMTQPAHDWLAALDDAE
jgi:Aminoglycoside-2''-adenylyltransferase